MRYAKCITCPQIGRIGRLCNGPNLTLLSTDEKREWLNAFKKYTGQTYDSVAAESRMPKSTVASFFTAAHPDVRSDTVTCIALGVIWGDLDWLPDMPCPEDGCSAEEKAAYEKEISALNAEVDQLEKTLDGETQKIDFLKKRIDFLTGEIAEGHVAAKRKDWAVTLLGLLCVLMLILIVVALIVDFNEPSKGFFWGVAGK